MVLIAIIALIMALAIEQPHAVLRPMGTIALAPFWIWVCTRLDALCAFRVVASDPKAC